MPVRFLADASLRTAIVSGCLRLEPAMDFLSAQAASLAGLPDPLVLAIAAETDRRLVTHDIRTMPGHLGRFLEANGFSPGVLLVKQYTPVADVVEALTLIWAASDADEWRNRILEIPWR
jgi:hypothetical protein